MGKSIDVILDEHIMVFVKSDYDQCVHYIRYVGDPEGMYNDFIQENDYILGKVIDCRETTESEGE